MGSSLSPLARIAAIAEHTTGPNIKGTVRKREADATLRCAPSAPYHEPVRSYASAALHSGTRSSRLAAWLAWGSRMGVRGLDDARHGPPLGRADDADQRTMAHANHDRCVPHVGDHDGGDDAACRFPDDLPVRYDREPEATC